MYVHIKYTSNMAARYDNDVIWRRFPSCIISVSEMTYIVSGGALNSTHSLTPHVLIYSKSSLSV